MIVERAAGKIVSKTETKFYKDNRSVLKAYYSKLDTKDENGNLQSFIDFNDFENICEKDKNLNSAKWSNHGIPKAHSKNIKDLKLNFNEDSSQTYRLTHGEER